MSKNKNVAGSKCFICNQVLIEHKFKSKTLEYLNKDHSNLMDCVNYLKEELHQAEDKIDDLYDEISQLMSYK